MHENQIGTIILDAAFEVHKQLGPGLLESTYEHCMAYELVQRNLTIQTQLVLPVIYKSVMLDCGYRIDIKVNDKVIIEMKAVEALNDIHMAQILTYMKLSGCKLGYLLNFNVRHLKDGIKRVALGNLPNE
ncbi:MAG: GxxExxY protein [Flavisolibacter sp.]